MPLCRVILQARTSSSRLPAKCLLPVAGYPAAVLAALRVVHPAWECILATSDDPSDDRLVRLALEHGLTVARGPLKDVLARFTRAAEGLPDDAIVVRLTADNLFPDARLLHAAVDEFVTRNHGYLITWTPALDVPHGLTVEVFRAGALREAAARAERADDREHVTPWIRRKFGVATLRPSGLPPGSGRLRCTMDTLEDYLRIASVFDGAGDPVLVSWTQLCARLSQLPGTPRFAVPVKVHLGEAHSDLVLGTAQLGWKGETAGAAVASRPGARADAGTSEDNGRREAPLDGVPCTCAPSEDEAIDLVRTALRHGVTHIDTGRAFGASERRIGTALAGARARDAHVVTRLVPMDDVGEDASPRLLVSLVDASVFKSCRELGRFTLPTLLVHQARDRIRWNGAVWKRLLALRDQGVIGTLGVSAATPEEALAALDDPDVRHVQIPFNLLDWRWKEAGLDAAAERRRDVTIHGRSPLLRGLLAAPEPARWPGVPGVDPLSILNKLAGIARDLGRESLLDLALAYARSHDWIHGVVTGFSRTEQLLEAVRLFTLPTLDRAAIGYVESRRDRCPSDLLDPSRWPR